MKDALNSRAKIAELGHSFVRDGTVSLVVGGGVVVSWVGWWWWAIAMLGTGRGVRCFVCLAGRLVWFGPAGSEQIEVEGELTSHIHPHSIPF